MEIWLRLEFFVIMMKTHTVGKFLTSFNVFKVLVLKFASSILLPLGINLGSLVITKNNFLVSFMSSYKKGKIAILQHCNIAILKVCTFSKIAS